MNANRPKEKRTPPDCAHGVPYGQKCDKCIADAARWESATRTTDLVTRLRQKAAEREPADMHKEPIFAEAADAIEAAKPILQEFARENPVYEWRGEKQDPCGVHELLRRLS